MSKVSTNIMKLASTPAKTTVGDLDLVAVAMIGTVVAQTANIPAIDDQPDHRTPINAIPLDTQHV